MKISFKYESRTNTFSDNKKWDNLLPEDLHNKKY